MTRPAFSGGADSVTTSYSGDWMVSRPPIEFGLAVHDHRAAGSQAAGEKPLPEPLQVDGAGAVPQRSLHQLQPALADVVGTYIEQLAFQGEGSAGVNVGDVGDVGPGHRTGAGACIGGL